MASELVKGVFVSEIKNRFLCLVSIDGSVVECYIPSSCRLSNFLSLDGKEVLLKKTQGKKTRTEYSVYAVKFRRGFLLLNLSQANRAIENDIRRRVFSDLGNRKRVSRELAIEGYKTDLYIHDTKTLIEIKSLLTTEKKGIFPTVFSERANNQLRKISKLLTDGYRVCYMLVSLNPYVEYIELNKLEPEFHNLFVECIRKGMICIGVTLKLKDGKPIVNRRIEIKEIESQNVLIAANSRF